MDAITDAYDGTHDRWNVEYHSAATLKSHPDRDIFGGLIQKSCFDGWQWLTGAKHTHDIKAAYDLIHDMCEGQMLLADKAYDANWIRSLLSERGAWANIPSKSNRKAIFSPHLYKAHNQVEVNKLKYFRRIATRYDKWINISRNGQTRRPSFFYSLALMSLPASADGIDCEGSTGTQFEMTFCAAQDFEQADKALNDYWPEIREIMRKRDLEAENNFFKKNVDLLLKAQRSWIIYRDAHCDGYALLAAGGTAQPMLGATCRAELSHASGSKNFNRSCGLGSSRRVAMFSICLR